MSLDRRNFIKTSAGAALSAAVWPKTLLGQDDRKARLGFIGTGLRGTDLLKLALRRSDTEINAVCDTNPEAAGMAQELVTASRQNVPTSYTNGEEDYLNLGG